MKASEFYNYFDQGFISVCFSENVKKYAGTPLRWKVMLPDYCVTWKIITNSNTSGLLSDLIWPGEFRCVFEYHKGKGKRKKTYPISVFEITSEFSTKKYRFLQIKALKKYLRLGESTPDQVIESKLEEYISGVELKDSSWCYYIEPQDSIDWSSWYARAIDLWISDYLKNYQIRIKPL